MPRIDFHVSNHNDSPVCSNQSVDGHKYNGCGCGRFLGYTEEQGEDTETTDIDTAPRHTGENTAKES